MSKVLRFIDTMAERRARQAEMRRRQDDNVARRVALAEALDYSAYIRQDDSESAPRQQSNYAALLEEAGS